MAALGINTFSRPAVAHMTDMICISTMASPKLAKTLARFGIATTNTGSKFIRECDRQPSIKCWLLARSVFQPSISGFQLVRRVSTIGTNIGRIFIYPWII